LAHSGIVSYRVAHKHFVTLARADYLREFMVKKQPKFLRGLFQEIMGQGLGRMLLTLDAEPWKKSRKLLLPGFSKANVDKLAESSLWAAERLCRRWHKLHARGESPNVVSDARFAAMESMFHMLFATEPKKADIIQLVEAGKLMSRQVIQRSQHPKALFLNRLPKMSKADQQARDRFDEVLRPYFLPFMNTCQPNGGVLLQAFLASGNAKHMPAEDIWEILSEEIRGLFMAGYETTADTLSWTLYHIARDARIASRLRDEVAGIDAGQLVEMAEFGKIPFCENLINESLRLTPPVPLVGRVATEDEVIGGYRIKKGTTVQASILGLHHNPEVWSNPEQFNPDRFTVNDPRLKNGNWVPFGFGPHMCVGAQLAMNSLKTFLLKVAQEFAFTNEESLPLRPKLDGVTAGPDREFTLSIRPNRQDLEQPPHTEKH